MSPEEKALQEDEDFVNLKRFDCSMVKVLRRYPNGDVPPRLIAQGLMMAEADVEELYLAVMKKLRRAMGLRPGSNGASL